MNQLKHAQYVSVVKTAPRRHPEWRMAQLDPHLTRLIQDALAPLATTAQPTPAPLSSQQRSAPGAAAQEAPAGGKAADAHAAAAAAVASGPQQPVAAAASQEVAGSRNAEAQGGGLVKQEPIDDESTPGPLLGALALADRPEPAATDGDGEGAGGRGAHAREAGHDAGSGAAADGADGKAGVARVSSSAPELRDAGVGAGASAGSDAGAAAVEAGGWCGPRPQEHLAEYCRIFEVR